ncbi:putative sarcosine oxidase [Talaromyces proteolyticus]|uniref:Sarcosine oxidase n=1 Tax=Talaromyces proteolyticus TaxID=1131652 RepID=A0AAD4KEN5_9EURO|nr:putative sarcosine oxidase [Talaromyces proteolyticus]KAH8689879.1 putative sarcosine oxidase [Talaromyces proteolyticus]
MKKTDPINIVGAGIFGLSTAIHLARRGYTKVTVFDKQPYDSTKYSYFRGCDAASADINKIIRSGYGADTVYQDLTTESIAGWKEWNEELSKGHELPPGISRHDRVFVNNGHLVLTDQETLPAFELATIANMESAGHKDTQLITTDSSHQAIAKTKGFMSAIDPFHREKRAKSNVGVLDTTGGFVIADKACYLALHKARQLGVKFILDPVAGSFQSLNYDPDDHDSKVAIGITTQDGKTHRATMNIIACGSWTPSLIPQLDGLCEATAGSVAMWKIPRQSPLFDRLAPTSFPSWQWKMRDGAQGGLYGFPCDENGIFKIGYRGTKYTHPVRQADGIERSVPITRWSSGNGTDSDEGQRIRSIPSDAMDVIQSFIDEYLPEVKKEGIEVFLTRLCWYNDSFDNHLLIDHLPGKKGVFVATGGSGHAFKYLPSIGNWVVDILEGVDINRPAIKAWRWRKLRDGQIPVNALMQGSKSQRALGNIQMSPSTDMPLASKL